MGAQVRGLGNSPTMEESHPLQLTAMSYIQQFPSPSRPYAPRESGGVIDGTPDKTIMTSPPHFYLLRNVNNVTVIMADLAITAPFISLS